MATRSMAAALGLVLLAMAVPVRVGADVVYTMTPSAYTATRGSSFTVYATVRNTGPETLVLDYYSCNPTSDGQFLASCAGMGAPYVLAPGTVSPAFANWILGVRTDPTIVGGFKFELGVAYHDSADSSRVFTSKAKGTVEIPGPAIDFARAALGAKYQLGAKGWDFKEKRYVEPRQIVWQRYHWSYGNQTILESAIDCSGLTLWSYNRAANETRWVPDTGEMSYAGADGQYWNATSHFSDDRQLSAGDLIFFDAEVGRPSGADFGEKGSIDHVAIYLGDGQTIEASPRLGGVGFSTLVDLKNLSRPCPSEGPCPHPKAIVGYGRPVAPKIGLTVATQSPVHLKVEDPERFSIDHETVILTDEERLTEVPGHLYYATGTDDHDVVYSPVLKEGSYIISVVPKEHALPEDEYGLSVTAAGKTLVLAEQQAVRDIPLEGYGVVVQGAALTEFVPAAVVRAGDGGTPVDLNSKGVLPVVILSTSSFDATTLDPDTVRAGPRRTSEAHGMIHPKDVNDDGFVDAILHFKIQQLGLRVRSRGWPRNGQKVTLEVWAHAADGRLVRAATELSVR